MGQGAATNLLYDQVGDHDPLVNIGGGVRVTCSQAGDASSGVYDETAAFKPDRDVDEASNSGLNAPV